MGEIIFGLGFSNSSFGVACQWHLQWDNQWVLLEGDTHGQTQAATPSGELRTIWNHPINVHFAMRSPLGWPKLVLHIKQIDEHGRSHLSGYGFCDVPTTAGTSQVRICCWRPTGSMRDEVTSFFMGNTAKLYSSDIVRSKSTWKSRCRLVTVPAGQVQVNFNIVFRNFME